MTIENTSVINTTVPHPARRYNYLLGGKDNFAADRESADAIEKVFPYARTAAVKNREWMHHIVRHLAGEAGVTQFIDIGVGLPVEPNLHQVAQHLVPNARILYADNDPHVMVHARALLTSTPEGATSYAQADLLHPERILAEARTLFDFDQPIAVLLLAVLHFIPDSAQPEHAVAELMNTLPAGSYLALTHGTGDFMDSQQIAGFDAMPRTFHGHLVNRHRDEIMRFFDGLDLVKPGLISTAAWLRPDDPTVRDEDCAAYAGLAVKP